MENVLDYAEIFGIDKKHIEELWIFNLLIAVHFR